MTLAPHRTIMAFDFLAYLARIDPMQSYVVQRVTGGSVNLTPRAMCNAASQG